MFGTTVDSNVIDIKNKLNQANIGKRGALVHQVLANLTPYVNAVKSPIGVEIIKEDLLRCDGLLKEIIAYICKSPFSMTTYEALLPKVIEFNSLYDRMIKITEKIDNYLKLAYEKQT